jgi:hypothetical protein
MPNNSYRRGRWFVVKCTSCHGISQDHKLDLLIRRKWQLIGKDMFCPKCILQGAHNANVQQSA